MQLHSARTQQRVSTIYPNKVVSHYTLNFSNKRVARGYRVRTSVSVACILPPLFPIKNRLLEVRPRTGGGVRYLVSCTVGAFVTVAHAVLCLFPESDFNLNQTRSLHDAYFVYIFPNRTCLPHVLGSNPSTQYPRLSRLNF